MITSAYVKEKERERESLDRRILSCNIIETVDRRFCPGEIKILIVQYSNCEANFVP